MSDHWPEERIFTLIYDIRGHKVMLNSDLADLYGVATKVLNQAVKRNPDRFPKDFMFQLSEKEWQNLKSQIVTLAHLASVGSKPLTTPRSNLGCFLNFKI